MQAITAQLLRLRRVGRVLLTVQRASLLACCCLGAVALLILADYLLRLPAPVRLLLLVAGLTALAAAAWTYLAPALRFAPDLTTLALRIEGRVPALRGRLASSVEFAAAGLDRNNPLAARAVAETQRRAEGALEDLIQPRRTVRFGAMLVLALAAAGLIAAAAPGAVRIGLERVLLPLSGAEWPARTGVESLMSGISVRPRGPALPLRARVVLGDPARTRVTAKYRLIEEGVPGPWRSIVLTYQGGRAEARDDAPQQVVEGADAARDMHERLVDTDADAIEFSFATADSATPVERIELASPPAVRRATLRAAPPAYASHVSEVVEELGPGTDARALLTTPLTEGATAVLDLELNKPLPAPAAAAPSEAAHAGAEVELPDPVAFSGAPDAPGRPSQPEAWLRRTFGIGPEEDLPEFEVDPDDARRWRLRWRALNPMELELSLMDEHGIGNFEEIAYRIPVAPDREPAATILSPQSDEVVSPTAIVPLVGEARDDLGIASLALDVSRRVSTGGDGSDGAHAAEAWELLRREERPGSAPVERLETSVDLAAIRAQPGDVLVVEAVAADSFELDGRRHEPVRSPRRTLRVVGETEMSEQLRRQLAAVRQSAIRIDAQQAEVAAVTERAAQAADATDGPADPVDGAASPAVPSGLDRRQAQVTERLGGQEELLEALAERLARNRLDDPELAATLELALDHFRQAGQASNAAAEALARAEEAARSAQTPGAAGRGEPGAPEGGAPEGPQERRAAEQERQAAQEAGQRAQARVRDELAALIELLDRDEDAWALTRRIEKLAEEVGQLQRDTERLGERTVGRDVDRLPAAERTELERIAAAQRDAADRARELTESLHERADRRQADPSSDSGVMRNAARTAEQQRLAEQLEQAGREVDANRLQNAQARQQEARATLQQMLQEIREGRRSRARELQRQLASLVQSIERLVALQEEELMALARAQAAADPAVEQGQVADQARIQNPNGNPDRHQDQLRTALEERSRAMIRLRQNTDAVIDEARAGGPDVERVARLLGAAAEAQGEAIAHLRSEPAAPDKAVDAEERALTELKEALAAARRTQERVEAEEAERQRAELLERYRAAYERQLELRDQTADLARTGDGGRRHLLEARRLQGLQEQLREQVAEIRASREPVAESKVFSRAHELVDEWSRRAEERLREGDAGRQATSAQERTAATILQIVQALESQPPEDEPFDDGQAPEEGGGGSSGQGQPPVIPPRSELSLLRGLQELILLETRAVDEGALDEAARRETLVELGRSQRALADLAQQMLEALGGGPAREAPAVPPDPEPGPQLDGQASELRGAPIGAGLLFAALAVQEQPKDAPARDGTSGAPATPPSSSPDAKKSTDPPRPKTLDELLGTEESREAPPADQPAAEEQRQERLRKALTEEETSEAFLQAVAQMSRSATLLEERLDPGIDTQRIQQEIIDKLDMLLRQPPRRSRSASSSSSSSSQQSPQQTPPSQPQSANSAQQKSADQPASDPTEAPGSVPRQEATLEQALESAGVEWGNLPARLREQIRQGLRDRPSTLYQRLTEEYYRRLAEDGSRG